MNRKVFITLLSLVCAYLVAYYILKFAFPEQFLLCITGTNLLKFGSFIESHKVLYYIISVFLSSFVFYMFACGCGSKLYLNWWQTLTVVCCGICNILVGTFVPTIIVHTSVVLMLLSSLIVNGKIFNTVLIFSVHGYCQLFLLNIRGFEKILPVMNFGTNLALSFEAYVWLILFYVVFNFKKKEIQK